MSVCLIEIDRVAVGEVEHLARRRLVARRDVEFLGLAAVGVVLPARFGGPAAAGSCRAARRAGRSSRCGPGAARRRAASRAAPGSSSAARAPTRSRSMPLSGWMRREVTPTVTWFASLMRSWPLNWFSVNIVAKLMSCSAAFEIRQPALVAERDVDVVELGLERLDERHARAASCRARRRGPLSAVTIGSVRVWSCEALRVRVDACSA